MYVRRFGFEDEDFLKGAFDPLMRRTLMIELLSLRKRTMIGFYAMLFVGVLLGLRALVTPEPARLGLMVCALFVALMCLAHSFHSDAKYKLVKVVETMGKGNRVEENRENV